MFRRQLFRRTTFLTILITALAMTAVPLLAADAVGEASEPIPGQYLVVLKQGVARSPAAPGSDLPTVGEVVSELARSRRAQPGHVFRNAVQGFVGQMTAEDAAALARDARVAWVEQDARVHPAETTQIAPPSWGLDRIDQHPGSLDGLYRYGADGSGVHVFVVDSGIRSTHRELSGRVDTTNAYSAIDDGRGSEDCFGHGTMVASLIAGTTTGIAKGATLHPVRVLGCDGSGAVSDVIAAIDWLTATVESHQKGKPSSRWRTVANLSLSFAGAPSTLNQAVYNSIEAGVVFVAAAGNDATEHCGPLVPVLGIDRVLAVGASDELDARASFSNYGSCVDVFAPGVSLQGAFIRDDTDTATSSGTSLSTAYVSGVAALTLANRPDASVKTVGRVLKEYATGDALSDVPAGTPNRLLYSFFDGDGVDEAPVPELTASCRQKQRDCELDASASFDDGEIVSYTWDFGDGESTTRKGAKTRHKYQSPGSSFTVTLTVTDGLGQTASVSRTISF